MDASFGHYINYTGIPDTGPTADPCDNEDIGFSDFEGHVALIQSLMQNEEFHSLYVNRYADMNNSFFTCDYMIDLLDEMIGRIEPEMPRQIERWGGTMAGWEASVQELRDFILTRCTLIDDGIEDCYDVEGPYPVTVIVEPAGSPNGVKVNTFIPTEYPFMGNYFAGTTLNFEAAPAEGWIFDHWEVATATFTPDEFASAIQMSIAEDEEIVAWFAPEEPCAAPTNFEYDSGFTNTTLTWTGLVTSLSYELKYREMGSTDDWELEVLIDPEYTIFGLSECTDYEAEIRSICGTAVSETAMFEFNTACVSSTEDENTLLEFNAFPNPFSDEFAVDIVLSESQDAVLEVFAMNGQKVYRQNLVSLQTGQNRIPVKFDNELLGGTYFVKLTTNTDDLIRKVVKQ
jgi:hypothetical protein